MNKDNIKNSNKSFWVLVSLILAIFFYGLFHNILKNEELKDNSEYTIGVVTKKYRIIKRGYYIHYDYKVKDKIFEGSQSINKKIKVDYINTGDKFQVKYSSDNPNYSELLFDKKVKNE